MRISLYGVVVTPTVSIVNEEYEGLIRYSPTFRRGPMIEDTNHKLSLPRAREIAKSLLSAHSQRIAETYMMSLPPRIYSLTTVSYIPY